MSNKTDSKATKENNKQGENKGAARPLEIDPTPKPSSGETTTNVPLSEIDKNIKPFR